MSRKQRACILNADIGRQAFIAGAVTVSGKQYASIAVGDTLLTKEGLEKIKSLCTEVETNNVAIKQLAIDNGKALREISRIHQIVTKRIAIKKLIKETKEL